MRNFFLRVLFLLVFLVAIVTVDLLFTHNSVFSQTQGYLSSEDCPECETEVANYNLHLRKLKEAGDGKKRFSVPVNLFNNVQLAKLIAQRCLASCAGTDNQFPSAILIDLIQVFSIFGNNPFDPVDPIAGGDTTGRGQTATTGTTGGGGGGGTPEDFIPNGTYTTGGGGCGLGNINVLSNSATEFRANVPGNGDVTFTGDGGACGFCLYTANGLIILGVPNHTGTISLNPNNNTFIFVATNPGGGACLDIYSK